MACVAWRGVVFRGMVYRELLRSFVTTGEAQRLAVIFSGELQEEERRVLT